MGKYKPIDKHYVDLAKIRWKGSVKLFGILCRTVVALYLVNLLSGGQVTARALKLIMGMIHFALSQPL